MNTMNAFVYFLAAPAVEMVKIGMTACAINTRLSALRMSSPVPLETLAIIELPCPGNALYRDGWGSRAGDYAKEVERRLHDRHYEARAHGEWFKLTEAILGDIDAINAGVFDHLALPPAQERVTGARAEWLEKRTEAIRRGKQAAKEQKERSERARKAAATVRRNKRRAQLPVSA